MMKTNKQKQILIILMVLSAILSSCGFDNEYSGEEITSRPSLNVVSTETDASGSDSVDILQDVEGYDYGERTFVIATTSSEYLIPSGNETLLDKAIGSRNQAVEKKFNIKLEIKVEERESLVAKAQNAVQNGEHYADLIIAPSSVLAELYSKECLVNINTLPYVEKEAEPELWEASQLNGKIYMLFSDLTQVDYSPWCVFYNDNIVSKTGVDPSALYKSGEWTWENFLTCSEKTSDYAESGFATTATEENFFNILWETTGNRFFEGCSESPLVLPKVENGKEILSEMKKIMKADSYNSSVWGADALDSFIKGKSGFLLCKRNAVYSICESGMIWKSVPMPKYSVESDHYSPLDGDAVATSVLKYSDSEFSGRILNALVVASEKTISEGIMQNELYYFWKDNTEAASMQEMKKFLYLDIATIYAPYVSDIAVVTTGEIRSAYNAGIKPFNFYHSTKRQFEIYATEAFG